MPLHLPVIAIVGRPNVGKSTFFNRVIGERKAIVEDRPGVTRDRLYALVERFEFPFQLIDTGGLEASPKSSIAKMVVEQTMQAIEDADVIICLFDSQVGVHPEDSQVMQVLRRAKKDVVFAANKCDDQSHYIRANDYYQLGCDAIVPLSSIHGKGAEELIRQVLQKLPNYAALCQSARDLRKLREEKEKAAREFMEEHIPKEVFAEREQHGSEDDSSVEDQANSDFETELSESYLGDSEDADGLPQFAPVFNPQGTASATAYEQEYKRLPDEKHEFYSNDETLFADDSNDVDLSSLDDGELEVPPEIECIKLAIIGRPNVGKSTMLNTLVGEDRAIVSAEAGTTRDTLDIEITREGQRYQIIDTAGLRKTGKVYDRVEQYSVLRALSALSVSDVAVVILDAVEGPTDQDAKIAGIAHEQGKGIIFVVNKWDLVEKDHRTIRQYDQKVRDSFKFASYAPIVYTSAVTGRRCNKIIEEAREVAFNRLRRIPSGMLNRALRQAVRSRTLGFYRGHPLKLYYATQVDVAPPRFVLFFNYPKELHFSHLRYLKNTIREQFHLQGCDLKIVGKKR